jgi:hypothetical protein
MRRTVGRLLAPLLAGALLAGATACSETADDRREAYCAQVKKDSTTLSKGVAEGGPGAFLDVLPTLQGLAKKAPSDLKDEWQTLLNALTGLRDALDATGLEPSDIQDGSLPKDLSRADRKRVRDAASVLTTPEVVAATQGIEQHALDICKQPLI